MLPWSKRGSKIPENREEITVVELLNKYLFGVAVPVMLIACGVFFCFKLRFFHVFRLGRVIKTLTAKREGEGTSPMGAVCLALAGTLGVGNIVGVSAAIAMGGFGAVFWMWVSALAAMLLKYAEIVLAMRYRRYEERKGYYGGAMYYIRDFLERRGLSRLGRIVAGVFAALCLFNALTMGSMVQMSAVGEALGGVWNIPPAVSCGLLALCLGGLMIKGRRGILKATELLVPIMTLGYIVLSVAVMWVRRDGLGEAFSLIFKEALTPLSAAAGIGGALLSGAVRYGVMRGIVSNEAGCGTAPAAHAVSSCKEPAAQGVWGIFEVFADTLLLCTMTALSVILGYDGAEAYGRAGDFMMMTISAYGSVLGRSAAVFLGAAVLFFGFATVLCWAHYGMECVEYFSRRRAARRAFGVLYTFSAFLGAVVSSESLWQATDLAVGGMTLINLVFLVLMSKEVKKETEEYFGG